MESKGIHISYSKIHEACEKIVEQARQSNRKHTCVIGIVRGGLVPATIISHMMNIPVKTIVWQTRDFAYTECKDIQIQKLREIIEYNYEVLLVDDICDSGLTLSDISESLPMSDATKVDTAALFWKDDNKYSFTPDYKGFQVTGKEWLYFPWELLQRGDSIE